MILELPNELEKALKTNAAAEGLDTEAYARRLLTRALGLEEELQGQPFETGRGLLAKYGPAPSADEIDANRADMFRGFGENGQ